MSDGALWFTERGGNIGRITTAGKINQVCLASLTGRSQNTDPVGITTGPDNALWFTEYQGNNIGRLDPHQISFTTPTHDLNCDGKSDITWRDSRRQRRGVADERRDGVVVGWVRRGAHDLVDRRPARLRRRRQGRLAVARHQRQYRHMVHGRRTGLVLRGSRQRCDQLDGRRHRGLRRRRQGRHPLASATPAAIWRSGS